MSALPHQPTNNPDPGRNLDAPRAPLVVFGRSDLTPKQSEVLDHARRGLTTVETARAMFVSEHTVKFHRTRVFETLGARTMAHAVAIAYERGLLEAAQAWGHCGYTLFDMFCPGCGISRNRVPGAETRAALAEAARRAKRTAPRTRP